MLFALRCACRVVDTIATKTSRTDFIYMNLIIKVKKVLTMNCDLV